MRIALLAVSLCLGCSDAAVAPLVSDPVDLPLQHRIDLGMFADCSLAYRVGSAGSCVAEWTCQNEGTISIACAPTDGGTQCACIVDSKMDPMMVDDAPTSCADDADVTTWARASCGWSFL